jgi:hypothetical protein
MNEFKKRKRTFYCFLPSLSESHGKNDRKEGNEREVFSFFSRFFFPFNNGCFFY